MFKKGHTHSEKTKRKISLAHQGMKKPWSKGWVKGNIPWNTGIKMPFPAWNKGLTLSLEYRKKLSLAHMSTRTTTENKLARNSVDNLNWRKAVYERDDYTCLICKKKGGRLTPHHVLAFARYKEYRFDIDNGRTLCSDCHDRFHMKYGNKKHTLEDWWDFFKNNSQQLQWMK